MNGMVDGVNNNNVGQTKMGVGPAKSVRGLTEISEETAG